MASQTYSLEKGWRILLEELCISAQDVLRHARLPLDLLLRKIPAVTAVEYFRFWEGLAHVSQNDPVLLLRLVQNVTAETMDPAIFACLSSNNLNIALNRIAIYKPMVAPVTLTVEQTTQDTSVTFARTSHNGSAPPFFIAFELAFWVHLARMATREHILPKAVHMPLDLPGLETYEAFFGTRICQNEPNRLTFTAVDAQKPFLTVNHAMWEILEPALNKRMENLTPTASTRDRVRACLIEMIASGEYSITAVASKLAISNRTLQRHLRQEGT
ncbi:MAG: AraC family transcriptional regulator ligand-binding domain-containing protein, partial [Anaerolineales bacterium]|nr:AraC family transcriptional regulator ligand-binding domain-containing protein [Anaerolineales bacterium]